MLSSSHVSVKRLHPERQSRSAIDVGFKKALSAIVDGNVTTLIAAAGSWH